MPLDATEDPRIALGRDPVPGASAAGADARDRPEFETLDAEIRRMESGGANAADWKTVIQAATVILRDQSKDLLVAAYLAYGLFRQERLHGLALGLSILRDVTVLYWPEAQPPARRLRGRVAIYEWLTTRLTEALATLGTGAEGAADAIAARDALTATDAFLSETLGPAAPSFGELARAIRPLAAQAEAAAALVAQQAAAALARQEAAAAAPAQPAVDQTPVQPTTTTAAGPARPAPRPQTQPQLGAGATAAALPPPPPLPEDLARSLSPLREWLRKAGLALLSANALDPRAYGLLAQATWLPLDALPAQTGGRSELPPPAPERLTDLLSRRGGEPKDFLLAIAGFCSGPGLFWLDGQFAISQSLAAMGAPAAAAAKAHDDAVRLCLSPFPGLTRLAFADGTPFLGDAGRAWLEPLLSGAADDGQGSGSPQPWVSGAIAAQELMTLNKPDEAFAVLTAGARAAAGQARAHWLTEGLRLALRTNDLALALALARRLTALVAEHRLADWDADFAAEILELAARSLALPEIGRFIPPAERTLLMTDWSTSLSGLDITRGRDAIKNFAILT
jgi:type VI secretion system protein VasJ